MIKHPGYIPDSSGGYNEYPFANKTKHLGVLDYMTWDVAVTKLPKSYYHPYYLHNINDSLLSLRDPVNAASMEMGIGRQLLSVVHFANRQNLGYPNQPVGVGYFFNIGTSGSSTWYNDAQSLSSLVVNSGFAVDSFVTTNLTMTSGIIDQDSKFTVKSQVTIGLSGSSYIDTLYDVNNKWKFQYGNIHTVGSLNLFDGNFLINTTSGQIVTPGNVFFSNNILVRDLVSSGTVSGFFDTYQRLGITDKDIIVYSTSGHRHDASGWSLPISDYSLSSTPIFDGRYYYALSNNMILRIDSTDTTHHWTPHRSQLTFNNDASLYLKEGVPVVANKKEIYIAGVTLSCIPNDNNITLSNGGSYALQYSVIDSDIFHLIDGFVYFIQARGASIVIYKFNGRAWQTYTSRLAGSYIGSYVSNSEIFIGQKLNQTKIAITRFNTLGIFKPLGSYNLFNNATKFAIRDHDLVVFGRDNENKSTYSLYLHNLNEPSKYQRLFYNLQNDATIGIYHNSSYIFIQYEGLVTRILINKSAALSLDAIGGLYDLKGNINIVGSLKTKSTVVGLAADSLYQSTIPIYQHLYLLEPGRLDDTAFQYTGDFKDAYINRYVFNQGITDAHTYNDTTCSIVFNNTYYFGHRGDISAFMKDGMSFKPATPARLDGKIVVKFLPLDKTLYALVQDYKTSSVDFLYGLPTSPKASEVDHTNFIPYLPGPWSLPVTRLLAKDDTKNEWVEDKKFTELYGLNIIDAISYDNNIYVLSHNPACASGIVSAKFAPNDASGVPMSFSGCLNLPEAMVGSYQKDMELWEYIPTSDGRYEIALSGVFEGYYPRRINTNNNGHNEFYMYNHPTGPYVVHDQVEVLYDKISPSSIFPARSAGNYWTSDYVVENDGNKYTYRTLSVTFLRQELERPIRINNIYDSTAQQPPLNVNNPNIKIPIAKDHPKILDNNTIEDKFAMTDRAIDKSSSRNNIHFITSIAHNKNIYLLVQVNQSIRIYAVRDFDDYYYNIPLASDPNLIGKSTIYGDGVSYAGIKTNNNYIRVDGYDNQAFYFDFVPCELSNTLVTEFDIQDVFGYNPGSVYVLGDGDDLFIQKSVSRDYRKFKRFSTHSSMSVGSNLYIPITVRVNYPTGRLYTFMLGFFDDGTVGLVDKDNVPIQLVNKPTGRTHCLYKDGRWVIASMKMQDGEPEYIDYRSMKEDPVYGLTLLENIPDSFNRIYNPNAKKNWIIGEYDITINDNLNVRETP